MKFVFCLLNVCLLIAVNEIIAKTHRDIFTDCVKETLGGYLIPMKPCVAKCGTDIFGSQTDVTKCFVNNDKDKYMPGVNCVRSDAKCYRKRKTRDVNDDDDDDYSTDDPDYVGNNPDLHERYVRAAVDPYSQVIDELVNNQYLRYNLNQYQKCKINCYIDYHSKNKKKLRNGRSGRSVRNDVVERSEDFFYHRERRQSDDEYVASYLGKCYKISNCKPSKGVDNKCMALFFPKKDPKKFCHCVQKYHANFINCDRYNDGPENKLAAQTQKVTIPAKAPQRNSFMNMNAGNTGFSASGGAGGNNWFSFSG